MQERGQDKLVARMMVVSGGVFLVSLIVGASFGWMSLGANSGVEKGIQVWIFGFSLAAILFVSALGIGLARAKGVGAPKFEKRIEDTRIVAITALNPHMNPIWNEETYAEEEIKRYVHLRLPSGRVEELRIDVRMLSGIGEGMKGNAIVYGEWMVGFEPTGI